MAGILQTQLVVFICTYLYPITGTRIFFYFPHVQLSTIDPGTFFEQSKCHNDALQQILYWFLRRKSLTSGSESNR
jgi:hypothetical protein